MTTSGGTAVDRYLAGLPDERRRAVAAVRDVILRHLPPGYVEGMGFGGITYSIPLARYRNTYNGQPLCYVALGAQKNYCSLYLMAAYADPVLAEWLARAFAEAGKKLDMGKSCVRFRSPDDLPLDAIGQFVARVPVEDYIQRQEAARAKAAGTRAAARTSGTRSAGTKTTATQTAGTKGARAKTARPKA